MSSLTRTYQIILWMGIFLFLPGRISLSQETAAEMLEKAFYYEDVQGDLNKAVELYEQILNRFPDVRESAAKAQLRIGVCYEKMGLAKAREAFQKVVDGYPEQAGIVELARKKLDRLIKIDSVTQGREAKLVVRQLLSGPDLFYDGWLGGVSPDGRYVSIVDWETGDLAIRELSTGKKQRLTDQKEEQGFTVYSAWSKDGTMIAYDWWKGDEFSCIKIIRIGDKNPLTVYADDAVESAVPMAWFSDGKRILVALWKKDTRASAQLAVIDSKDGSNKSLPVRTQDVAFVSPDGRFVAFNKSQGEGVLARDIYLYDMVRATSRILVEHSSDDEILGWSPDGRWVLFRSSRLGSEDAWVTAISEGKTQGDPILIKRGIEGIYSLGFSREGTFYFITSKKMWDIYRAEIDPDELMIKGKPEKLELPTEGRNEYPAYSPDGKSLAYIKSSSRALVTPSTLHIRTLDSGKEKIVPLDFKARFPDWSPDLKSILVTGIKESRAGDIYRINVRTGGSESIVRSSVDDSMGFRYNEWHPDGKSFFTVEGKFGSPSTILRIDLETRKKDIVFQADEMGTISLSPDGERIAFLGRDRERALIIIPVGGGEPRVLCRFIQSGSAPIHTAWTPDGSHLLLFHQPDTAKRDVLGESLFKVSLADGKMEEIGVSMISPGYDLAVHPNGREIIFSSLGFSLSYPEYWAMENFLPVDDAMP